MRDMGMHVEIVGILTAIMRHHDTRKLIQNHVKVV